MKQRALLVFLLAASLSGLAQNSNPQTSAQTPAPAPSAAMATPTAPPPARTGDVDSIEHIIAANYDVISGPAGGQRDWDRFRSLYYPGAHLIPSRRDDKGAITARVIGPDDFPARVKDIFSKDGFYESSIANHVDRWDHMAQVWSTYESRHAKGEKPFARGVNGFQLMFDGSRWWILSVYWEGEDPAHPLPEQPLK